MKSPTEHVIRRSKTIHCYNINLITMLSRVVYYSGRLLLGASTTRVVYYSGRLDLLIGRESGRLLIGSSTNRVWMKGRLL